MGEIEPQVPRLRKGSYFSEWLLEPRRRSKKALTAVVVRAFLLGVSQCLARIPNGNKEEA